MFSLLFIVLAGIFNSVMDTVQFRYGVSYFSILNSTFWDPKESWKNKWKNGDPVQGEKFPGSSTVFVFCTDAWHLFQALMISAFCLAVVFYSPVISWWADALIYHAAFGVTFELFWRFIWRKQL